MLLRHTAPGDSPREALTINPAKTCQPIGAMYAALGIHNCLPHSHGSQGCCAYHRSTLTRHYKEQVLSGTSSFTEGASVFGGQANLLQAIDNIFSVYNPDIIAVHTTCLSETIGDDITQIISKAKIENHIPQGKLVIASTPSYAGSHLTGFHKAVLATAKALAVKKEEHGGINIMPGMISPADIRYIKRICQDLGISAALLPDYSDTLDGVSWPEYHCFPEGGTPVSVLKGMGGAKASIELCRFSDPQLSAASFLEKCHGLPAYRIGLPVGVRAADEFMDLLSGYAGRPLPDGYTRERGRLLDAYVDAHKYVFGRKALVYGDADFVMGIGRFLAEIGMVPVLCTADKGGNLAGQAEDLLAGVEKAVVLEGADFADIETLATELKPDIFIGSSKGYKLARLLGVPLVRLGFPVHDRLGGARLRCVGYAGTQELFDRIVNALLEHRQDESDIGYSYM